MVHLKDILYFPKDREPGYWKRKRDLGVVRFVGGNAFFENFS
jgi:hypothetical protein